MAGQLNDAGLAPEQRVSLRCHVLGRRIDGTDYTFVEFARRLGGGRVPEPTGDALVDGVVRLGFSGLAMEAVDGASWDRVSISAAFQDPHLCNPAAGAFLGDADLARLFPGASGEPDEGGRITARSFLTWLPAGGGTTFLPIVVGALVEQTLARMRFMDALQEERLEEFVRDSLDQLRRFARGEEVSTLLLTGLMGVEVEGALDRDLWGLRPASGLAIFDTKPQSERQPRSVAWLVTSHRLLDAAPADLSSDELGAKFKVLHEHSVAFSEGLTRRVQTLQFALMAWANERSDISPCNVLATTAWSLLPISASQTPYVFAQRGHGQSVRLTSEDLEEVAQIVDSVGELSPRVDIALSRMIRVASERRDPIDALIDAIVAWENMLGSKSETTFKVCASMAWLLEPEDEGRRIALLSRAKEIYGLRSDFVHGSTDARLDRLGEFGSEALSMAIRAFRLIHEDASLRELKSSTRSERVMMRTRGRLV